MKKQRPIDLNRIEIADEVFSRYISLVDEVAIPYQYKMLCDGDVGGNSSALSETSPRHEPHIGESRHGSCIDNFRIAAGEKKGEHSGTVFLDTDLYKWLETVAYALERGKAKEYEAKADEAIELIARAQCEDGYVNTYYTIMAPNKRWSNLVEGHELYSAGHLIEAAVAYYSATGKDRFLNVAKKFADLIYKTFGTKEGQIKGYPGHQIIELALMRLYEVTKEERYFELAKYFIDERGKAPNYFEKEIERRGGLEFFVEFANYSLKYSQAHLPVREQRHAEGHAVRCMYMCSAMADIASESDDESLMDACRAIWENTTEKRMFITGGIGSSGRLERFTTDYDLPNASAYCETCASIGLAMFSRRMTAATCDGRYYDAAERALYNTVLSGIGINGSEYFYVNPLEMWQDACIDNTSMEHVKPTRQRWFSVACCPPNIARTLASLGNYIYAKNDNTLFVNLYISSSVSADLEKARVKAQVTANVVTDGRVKVSCVADEVGAKLAVRIPKYAESPVFILNNMEIKPEIITGYAYIPLSKGENQIAINFNVKPVFVAADSRVRADAGQLALVCGPVVYCLEEADNDENLSEIEVDPTAKVDFGTTKIEEMSVPTLSYDGKRVKRKGEGLYNRAVFEEKKVRLTAVPYAVWCNREKGEMRVWQRAAR